MNHVADGQNLNCSNQYVVAFSYSPSEMAKTARLHFKSYRQICIFGDNYVCFGIHSQNWEQRFKVFCLVWVDTFHLLLDKVRISNQSVEKNRFGKQKRVYDF